MEQQTHDKIKELLGASAVSKDTDLILTNAIYFKGAWAVPFHKEATKDEPFGDGTNSSPVPTMHQTERAFYLESSTFQALELGYLGGKLSMVILLPKQIYGLAALEASLSSTQVETWLGQLGSQEVVVSLPRFQLESANELTSTLADLGMPLAFSREADFSAIATDRRLFLSAVIHKAFAEVNEKGTEAAAATGVGMARMSAVQVHKPPVVFKADHPFLFLIRDRPSGSILFLGRVTRPQG